MKSATLGRRTSQVEVTNVSPHGFWLFVGEQELFVSFKEFPWFKDASIREISHVELPSAHHLYWPDLDIDLAVDSLTHPKRYPLISEAQRSLTSACSRRRRASTSEEACEPFEPPRPQQPLGVRKER
jgi:hypothetical protein